MIEENKEEGKLQSLKGKCVVTNYGGSYWDGTASYCSDFGFAKIFNESELPEFVKEEAKVHSDPYASDYAKANRDKIIRLDTEEGLELLVEEFVKNQRVTEVYGPKVRDAESNMKKLLGFDSVSKYIDLHNKWYNPLIGISHETEKKIIEEIVNEKA